MKPELDRQLWHLLVQEGKACVPGLGTFVRNYRSASKDISGAIWLPPGEEIFFTETEYPDKSLSVYLSSQLFYPLEAAQELESNYVRQIWWQLANDGLVDIPALGLLERNEQGKLEFYPSLNLDVNDNFFGLASVSYTQETQTPFLNLEKKPTGMNNGQSQDRSGLLQTVSWHTVLLVGVLISLGVLIIYNGPFFRSQTPLAQNVSVKVERSTPFTENYSPSNDAGSQPFVVEKTSASQNPANVVRAKPIPEGHQAPQALPKTTPAPSESDAATEIVEETVEEISRGNGETRGVVIVDEKLNEKTRSVNTPNQNQVNTPEEADDFSDSDIGNLDEPKQVEPVRRGMQAKYHLIAGSFSKLREARRFMGQMENRGFSPLILDEDLSPTAHRVSIYQSSNRKEVEAFAAKLRQSGLDPLWIFER